MLYDPKWEQIIEAPALEEWRQILLKAADLIREKGLAQFTQQDCAGALCLHGAISVAKYGRPLQGEARSCPSSQAVYRYLKSSGVDEKIISIDGCAHWNNEPGRTADEVIAALEGAARH